MRYTKEIALLAEKKLEQTKEKFALYGFRDEDDYGCIAPPADFSWEPPVVTPEGSFSGTRTWGKNFRSLMEHHPLYVDPFDALAGRWMFMLSRMRKGYKLELANFAFDYSHLLPIQEKYNITCGIGKDAHFAPDYSIGLELGWNGLLEKVRKSLARYGDDVVAKELLEAEIDAIEGIQNWISRTADEAGRMAKRESDPKVRKNLQEIEKVNKNLINDPPKTLREACQWIAWFNMASRTYNRDGAGGQLDELLRPYYEKDIKAGRIDDEDAEYYIACLLLNDPHYYQLGGPNQDGLDVCSPISFIILEAAAKLNISCNITLRVHDGMNRQLFQRGVEILIAQKKGFPRFSGDKALVEGFVKNGFSKELARTRIATGCNWMSLPGLEYTLNDVVKINIAKVFEVAFLEMENKTTTLEKLKETFIKHFAIAVDTTAQGIDFHLDHQYLNEPELCLNLLSHGPIEKGLDVSHGGAAYYNMAIDCAGLATVADSFGAIEQRVVNEKKLSWEKLYECIKTDYTCPDGEAVRILLKKADKYGKGGSVSDAWALELTKILNDHIALKQTPGGRNLIPGWFSWADTVRFGKSVGATPDGRKAKAAIAHGANPNPGFRRDAALTAMSDAVAMIQPGYGNTAPWQLEVDLDFANHPNAVEYIMALIESHFEKGGTLININIVDSKTILAAHENPEDYPDLIVRVTGFSAYFMALSKDFRQLVVNRIISE
jgi:formate C-acetyltransferase